MVLSSTDFAYIAGFMDGEGSFTFRKTPCDQCVVSCGNTDASIVAFLKENFGGEVSVYLPKGGRRNIHHWKLCCGNASKFCESIIPFLRQKRERAELLIAIQRTMSLPGKRLAPGVKERRYELAAKLKELNQ